MALLTSLTASGANSLPKTKSLSNLGRPDLLQRKPTIVDVTEQGSVGKVDFLHDDAFEGEKFYIQQVSLLTSALLCTRAHAY